MLQALKLSDPKEKVSEKMFRRCPSCERLFVAKEIKREGTGEYEAQEHGGNGSITSVQVENYKLASKCDNCGYEWTDIIKKPVALLDRLNFVKF